MSHILIIGAGFSARLIASSLSKDFTCTLLANDSDYRCASKNSLRIMHGGLRYLQGMDLKRIWDSLTSQNFFLQNYPNHVEDLYSFLPTNQKRLSRNIILLFACSKLYNFIKKCHDWHSSPVSSDNSFTYARIEKQSGIYGLKWHELTFKPFLSDIYSDITTATIRHAKRIEDTWLLQDEQNREWKGRLVIDTGGYGTEELIPKTLQERCPKYRMLAWNLKYKPQILKENQGYGIDHKGKVYFAVGRSDALVIGTGYKLLSHRELQSLNTFIADNQHNLRLDLPPPYDTLKTQEADLEYGILPCNKKGELVHDYDISHQDGYVRVTTNKLTTTPIVSQKVVKLIKNLLRKKKT